MFENYAWLAWIGVALALGAVEAASATFVFLMLAGGALGGSAAAALGAPVLLQVVVAVLVSGVLLGLVRPWAQRRFGTARAPGLSMGTAGYIGRSAYVLETVTVHGGQVKLGGETWTARSSDPVPPKPGDEVRVVRIDGATAVVTRVTPADAP
jgi:membrane protein implicated in regulation of membrane protease activity